MAEITPEIKTAAIKAWHDANTDEKKAATVKQYPFLTEIYALAANFAKAPNPAPAPAPEK
jgi:hypothetical protein